MSLKVNFFNEKVTSISFLNRSSPDIPEIVNYSNVFLRDASTSPDSYDKASRIKLNSTASISKNVIPVGHPKVVTTEDTHEDAVEIHWSDGNVSVYPKSFLEKYSTEEKRRENKFFEENEDLWDNLKLSKKLPKLNVSFDYFVNDERSLYQSFNNLNHYGLTFIDQIADKESKPLDTDAKLFETITNRIGYLKETIFGRYSDIISDKEAEHRVLSNKMFHLHQDLLFYQSPPSIKIIESVKNQVVSGGENIFVDLFNAARYVLEKDPHAYFALTTVPITFHYKSRDGHYFVYSRPLIVEDSDNIDPLTNYPYVREVNYAPPYQAPFEYGITSPLKQMGEFADKTDVNKLLSAKETGNRYLFRDFHRGLKIFEEFIFNEENQFKIFLKSGTAVLFNNRRLAHARTQFIDEHGGDRWFRIGFIDFDVYYSRLRYLNAKYD